MSHRRARATVLEATDPDQGSAVGAPSAAGDRGPRGATSHATPYLTAAESLLAESGTGRRGWWPRAVVWLLRIQLESDIAACLRAHGVPVPESDGQRLSHKAQNLMLHRALTPAQAREVATLWEMLSAASHHHSYELAPTHSELHRWVAGVREASVALHGRTR